MNLDKSLNYYSKDSITQIGERFVTKSTIEIIKPNVVGKKVLNLGLGNGKTSLILDNISSSQVVVEGSKKIIESFSFESAKTTFVESYFENFKTKEKFDVVRANHVLEHVDDPIKIMTIKFNEWLSNDGIALITVPNARSIHRLIGKDMGIIKNEYELNESDIKAGHKRVYDIETLKKQINVSGLDIISLGGYNIKMVSLYQMREWSQELLNSIYRVSKKMPPEICSNIWVKVKIKK